MVQSVADALGVKPRATQITPQNPRKAIEQVPEKPFALDNAPKPEPKRPTVENIEGKQKSSLEGAENDLPGQKYLVPDVGRTAGDEAAGRRADDRQDEAEISRAQAIRVRDQGRRRCRQI